MLARDRRRSIVALVLLGAVGAGARARAAPGEKPPSLGLGYEYDLSGAREEFLLPDPIVDPSIAADHPLYVRIRAPWSLLEREAGVYDWSEVDRIVDPYRAANFVVDLCLYGPNPAIDAAGRLPSSANPDVLKRWLGFARAAATHFKGRVRYYEIWQDPNREAQWPLEKVADYAYLLKNTSVTIRSVDPAGLIVQGGLALGATSVGADLAWQEALYRQEIATYVDVLPVHPDAGIPLDAALARAYDLLPVALAPDRHVACPEQGRGIVRQEHDPSARLWASDVP